ncbi:MAG: helix-turn-helix transcriptional regulator [Candidatus Sumerlaeia bacterium]|nr:helix-turn-helix transcriptional regulator [Candidatus Sumerlaeia bacterium]
MDLERMSDQALLGELGRRVQRERLNQNLRQVDLAKRSGLSVRAIRRLEAGEGVTLENFLRVLRGLGRLGQLDNFLPDPGYSPIQLAQLAGSVRERASPYGRERKKHDGEEIQEG